jgi:hypothetical protein|tara:strand:- start:188 stop:301 length:114 start_codon:yes stop_codon:yes gene_type:complete
MAKKTEPMYYCKWCGNWVPNKKKHINKIHNGINPNEK